MCREIFRNQYSFALASNYSFTHNYIQRSGSPPRQSAIKPTGPLKTPRIPGTPAQQGCPAPSASADQDAKTGLPGRVCRVAHDDLTDRLLSQDAHLSWRVTTDSLRATELGHQSVLHGAGWRHRHRRLETVGKPKHLESGWFGFKKTGDAGGLPNPGQRKKS